MRKTVKTAVSGLCAFVVSAGVLAGRSGAVAVSTGDIKTDFDATEVLSQQNGLSADKAVQDYVFDGNPRGGKGNLGGASAVRLNFAIGPSANAAVTQAKPAAKALSGAVPPLNDNTTVKVSVAYKGSGMEVSGNGIYRSGVYTETKVTTTKTPVTTTATEKIARPWWKLWAPKYTEVTTTKTEEKVEEKVETKDTPALEKAVADSKGGLFNAKGEFVGQWKTILNADLKTFSVAQDKNGQDHIYNWTSGDGVRQVFRDGKPAAVFATEAYGGTLAETRVGADGKIYAKYQASKADVIVSMAPGSNKQSIVEKLPVQVDVWTVQVPETGHYEDYGHFVNRPGTEWELKTKRVWDSEIGEYKTTEYYVPGTPPYNEWVKDGRRFVLEVPAHREQRSSTSRIDRFEVDKNGRVTTLFRGNVVAENAASGYRNVLPGGQRYKAGEEMDYGSTTDYKIDPRGNIYSLNGKGLLSLNGVPVDTAGAGFTGAVDKLIIDAQGNLYKAGDDGSLRRYPVNPDSGAGEPGVS